MASVENMVVPTEWSLSALYYKQVMGIFMGPLCGADAQAIQIAESKGVALSFG
jgi:hypothetical protein